VLFSSARNLAALSLFALATACSGSQPALPSAQSAAPPFGLNGSAAANAAAASGDVVADPVALRAAGARDAGRAASNATLDVAFTLQYRHQDQLDRLVANQQTKGTSQYHHWLTGAEFESQYAPSAASYDRLAASLRRAGMRVAGSPANRTVLDATASVASIERYFGTEIHKVVLHGGSALANVTAARMPRELAGSVVSVDGLSTIPVAVPLYVPAARGVAQPMGRSAAAGQVLFGPVSTVTGLEGYGPAALQAAYDMPIVHAGGRYDGAGRTAAIVIDADFENSDLASFLKYFHIRRTAAVTRVLLNGGPAPGDQAIDSVEATLDVETIAANAPGAKIYVYETPSLSNAHITDTYARIISDNFADVVNSSFGGCETEIGKTALAWSKLAEQGLAKGITFAASSGDSGGVLCPLAPASSPNFVALGGTALQIGPHGAWQSEIAWSGSGGGISATFAAPPWQTGVTGLNARGRNLPDLAFDADPYTGAAFFYDGTWDSVDNPIGGTSLASPLFSAAAVEMNQVKGARLGLSGASFFSTWATGGYGTSAPLFHDISIGTNGAFPALPGYDLVTGIGSIDAWNIVQTM
jgi:pseudomonalisin